VAAQLVASGAVLSSTELVTYCGYNWDVRLSRFLLSRQSLIGPVPVCRTALYFVRSEVLRAVTMKNVVFWDIKSQFIHHRRHITSPLQSPAS
jgi:hypothetical protein